MSNPPCAAGVGKRLAVEANDVRYGCTDVAQSAKNKKDTTMVGVMLMPIWPLAQLHGHNAYHGGCVCACVRTCARACVRACVCVLCVCAVHVI